MQPRAGDDFVDVSGLLNPKSVAVIGASDRPGNLGGDTVRRLLKFKFPGPVYPVNRGGGEVAGLKAYASVRDLPTVPQCVVFVIPAEGLYDAIQECIDVGIRNGLAYAGGLGEAGGEGLAQQNKIAELCRKNNFALCGPNCVGIINCATPVTMTFATALHELDSLKPGAVSMVSQSGGLGTSLFGMMRAAGFGFRHLISSGNEATVSFADYLYALARDEGTRVICAYLEGVRNGPKLVRALEEARLRNKPVVIVKSGRSAIAARAAQAHTGALVGEDRVLDAILQEFGAIRVSSIEELADVALMLANLREGVLPKGPGVGIVTFGGGNGVLGVDQCMEAGLTVPPPRPEDVAALKQLLLSTATASNPVDLTPGMAFRAEAFEKLPATLDAVAAQPQIDSVLMIASSLASRAAEITKVMGEFKMRSRKPVIISWPDPPNGLSERLAAYEIYPFIEPARAAKALGRLVKRNEAVNRPPRPAVSQPRPFDWNRHVPQGKFPLVVSEDGAHGLMKAAGLPVAEAALVTDEAGALRAAEKLGLPVVLKGISPKVTHRAAAGLLAVDLRTREDVAAAYRRLAARAKEIKVDLDGVYIQKMYKSGVELMVSAFHDPIFGPVVSVASGGGLTELINDVVIERAPVNADIAAAMIERLRIRAHAKDGQGPLPAKPAAEFIARLSELAASAPWGAYMLEVNPIKWSRDGAIAVDGLLIIEQP
jgi:acyl-CoA synthetase (NDP forming)